MALEEPLPQGMSALLQNQHLAELKLQDSMQTKRDKHNKRLEERLAKRQADRVSRLVSQGISRPDAELLVAVEVEEERGIEEEAVEKEIQETQAQVIYIMMIYIC